MVQYEEAESSAGSPTKPKIAAFPSSKSVEEGTSLNLNCSSSSTTYPPDHNLKLTYFWEIKGKPLLSNESNERFHVKGAFLKIVSIDRSDRDKRFACRVHEENGLSRFSTFSPNVTCKSDRSVASCPVIQTCCLKQHVCSQSFLTFVQINR